MEETSLRNRREDERSVQSIQSQEPKTTRLQKEVRPSLSPGPSQVQCGKQRSQRRPRRSLICKVHLKANKSLGFPPPSGQGIQHSVACVSVRRASAWRGCCWLRPRASSGMVREDLLMWSRHCSLFQYLPLIHASLSFSDGRLVPLQGVGQGGECDVGVTWVIPRRGDAVAAGPGGACGPEEARVAPGLALGMQGRGAVQGVECGWAGRDRLF